MQDNNKEYLDKFNSIISKLAFKSETLWFLDILYKLEVRFVDDKVPTAGVCMINFKPIMIINKKFISNLSDDEYSGLILHELLHLALFHNSRIHNDYNMMLWNAACDLEVNSIIDTYKMKLPEVALLPKKFKFENRLSSEMYYKKLLDQKKNNQQNNQQNNKQSNNKGQGQGQGQGSGSGQGQGDGQNDNKDSKDNKQNQQSNGGQGDGNDIEKQYQTLDDHQGWSKDEAEADMQKKMLEDIINEAVSNNENNIDEQLKEAIKKAEEESNNGKEGSSCSSGKEHGNIGGSSVKHIVTDDSGTIKWNYILNRLIRRTLSKSYIPSFKRTNRRYGEQVKGHIKNHEVDNIIIAVDTSGSIDEDLHKRFMQEIKLIQRMFKIKIRYIQCDAYIQDNFEFKRYMKINDIEIKGGGGTDFRPVFKLIDEKHYNPNAILYFTDGIGDYPETSKYNTLWILSNKECLQYKETTPPFGTTIFLNEN